MVRVEESRMSNRPTQRPCRRPEATSALRLRGLALTALLVLLGAGHLSAQRAPRTDQLGATLQKSATGKVEGVTFRVWAPHAKTVSVTGTFNNWNKTRDALRAEGGNGIWSGEVRGAKPGDEYMFVIDGTIERKDPRARKVTSSDGRSVIYDRDAFDWGPSAKRESAATLNDLVIYQLHPGTFYDPNPHDEDPGTLRDAMTKLDHLKDMGVNCILLMPVNEFPGRHSWGYNPSDQFAVESAYGGPDALKEFVKACHERDIAVHLDIVHNHYNPDGEGLWQFDGTGGGETGGGIYFYEDAKRGHTPWGPRPNYGRPEVREFIADQVRMWFDEYKIDGLRWDSTINIRAVDNGADINPDGEQLLHRIARMIRQEYPGKISIAEDSVGDPRFDSSWQYDFHHGGDGGVVPQLVKSSDAARQVEDIAHRITSNLGFRRVIYTENHDETGRLNGKKRNLTDADEADPHSLLARRKHALAAVLTLTSPGVPLVFMGQELSEDREFHDDTPLNWQRGEDAFHAFQLYRDLVHLRRNSGGQSAALTGTHARVVKTDETKHLLAYRRYLPGRPAEDLYVVINFSGEPVDDYPLTFPQAGQWKLLLNTDDVKYGREFGGVATSSLRTDSAQKITVQLAPYSAQIFGVGTMEPSVIDLDELRDQWDETHGQPELATAAAEQETPDGAEATPPMVDEVALTGDAAQLVVTGNFTQPRPWDPSNEGMRMGLIEDHIWETELGFANGRNIQVRIVNPATGREYGGSGVEPGGIPTTGTAVEDGAPIVVTGPLNGDYALTFNEKTLRYRFEPKAASRFGRINVMGNFNGWNINADPLYMTGDFNWQAEVDLEPGQRLEFVFIADGSLEKQWGDDTAQHTSLPATGTATEVAQTIKIESPAGGLHRFTFNEETGEYTVAPLDSSQASPLPAVPAPVPVKEIRRARAK